MRSRFRHPLLVVDGAGLDFWVEQRAERFPWLAENAVFGQDDEPVEEGLVCDASQ